MIKKSISFKIILLTIVFCIFGWFVASKLSLKLNPSQKNTSISIMYTWPNANPKNIENQISAPVESVVSTLRGVESIKSQSSKGFAFITIDLDEYTDVQQLRFEISTLLRQISVELPQDVSYPRVSINAPDEDDERQQAFLSYSIESNETQNHIKTYTENSINPVLASIKGVDRVEVMGVEDKEWVLRLNYDQLNVLGIASSDIVMSLQNYFDQKNLGFVNFDHQRLNVVLSAPEEMSWHIPVAKVNQRIIYLDDIASIVYQDQAAQSYFRVNAKNAISFQIFAESNANTLDLAKKVKSGINEIEQNLPNSYSVTNIYDDTEYISQELDKIYERTFYTILILLVFVFLVSLNFRYVVHIVLGLLVNISIAFGIYYLLGIEIQLYSLAGITISLGLIVDNIIVMLDHLKTREKQNIFVAILASTLTSLAGLSVVFLMDEQTRLNLLDFAYVIMINLSSSLFVTFLFIPALLRFWPLSHKNNKVRNSSLKFYVYYERFLKFTVKHKRICIAIVVLAVGIPTFMLPSSLQDDSKWYSKLYNVTYGNAWFQENMRPTMDKAIGGSFRLFSVYVFENAYYKRNEETQLVVDAAMEKAAGIEQMNEVFLRLENYLLQFPEIKQFSSNIQSSQYGRLKITFNENESKSRFPHILKARLTEKALDLGGMNWNIYGVGQGFTSSVKFQQSTDFMLHAKGYNYTELNAWSDTLSSILLKHPRINEVYVRESSQWRKKPAYSYQIGLDKNQLALYNSHTYKTYNDLKELSLSLSPTTFAHINGKYESIRLESERSRGFDIWQIKNEPLRASEQNTFKLKDIATVEKIPTEENIFKEDQEYIRVIEFPYTGSEKFGNQYLEESLEKLKQKLPLGFTFEKKDRRMHLNEQAQNYSVLLLLVIFLIYVISSSFFESFTQPFVILSVIPISYVGVFLSFYYFDFNFDQGGLASFLLLSGITVNASIYLINAYNVYRKTHQDKFESYILAFKSKIFPIMLTILSTILGFIPFVKDGQNEVFWFALGVGTIGGLLFSMIAIIIFLPCFLISKNRLEA